MTKKAPIAFFAYKRPEHMRRALESLALNQGADDSELFIYCDGPRSVKDEKNIAEVREIVKSRRWCGVVHIIEQEENQGLAHSIIAGVNDLVERFGQVIVVEDDLVLSPQFLNYMNGALEKYKDSPEVFSITGFNYPAGMLLIPEDYPYTMYFGYRAHSWSWATWKNRWKKVDFDLPDFDSFMKDRESRELFKRGGEDLVNMLVAQVEGKIDSWAIRFCYGQFKECGYTLYPVRSLVGNAGLDSSGTHCGRDARFDGAPVSETFHAIYPELIEPDEVIAGEFRKIFKYTLKQKVLRIITGL